MTHRRKLVAGALAGALALVVGIVAASGTSGSPPTAQTYARLILSRPSSRFMTAPARTALAMIASGDRRFGSPASLGGEPAAAPTQQVTATATLHVRKPAPAAVPSSDVRVNDPATDHAQLDQTTQSETTIAVSGRNVVVGYNDSQQTLTSLTAGSDLTGFSYSSNGGATWTDGGSLPNAKAMMNMGDPWLASAPDGNFYYSSLAFDPTGALAVVVARSTNGGRSFATPVQVSPNLGTTGFAFADKPALTSGPTPGGGTALYDTWDDSSCDMNGCANGLPVARSTDGGLTWQLTYAARWTPPNSGCSFTQWIGAQPLVNPDNGTLYVAAEKIWVVDPNCLGTPVSFSEVLYTSTDGGQTFSGPRRISDVTPAFATGAMQLGPGQFMRTIEFPSLAIWNGSLYVAWNDGRLTGHSHILLASSPLNGGAWNLRFVTQGNGDEVQPALTSDASGLHLLYYGRTGSMLDVYAADATDPASWTVQKVNSKSSPGVFTAPQFDPIIAFGYMGDYIANVTDGSHRYYSWGDNRDIVTNALWPKGRHDPDVFFTRR